MKRLTAILSVALFLSCLNLHAQWAKSYAPGAGTKTPRAFLKTQEGGYVIAGTASAFSFLGWILKLGSDGTAEWRKGYRAIFDLSMTADGGFLTAGYFGILQLDPSGEIDWELYTPNADFFSVRGTSDGGMIASGRIHTGGGVESPSFVMKRSSSKQVEWTKQIKNNECRIASVHLAQEDGNIIIAHTEKFGFGKQDACLLKLSPSGDIQWQKIYGSLEDDEISCIQPTLDGGYIVTGSTCSAGFGQDDIWIMKLFDDGNMEWQKLFGNTQKETASFIQPADDGGYFLCGTVQNTINRAILVMKITGAGETTWQRSFGSYEETREGGERGHAILQIDNGSILVTGNTNIIGIPDEYQRWPVSNILLLEILPGGSLPDCDYFREVCLSESGAVAIGLQNSFFQFEDLELEIEDGFYQVDSYEIDTVEVCPQGENGENGKKRKKGFIRR